MALILRNGGSQSPDRWLKEPRNNHVYGVDASAEMISHMTDRILPIAKEWQNRPLERKYAIVFMDAVHFHVREDNRTVKKAVYVAIGVKLNGKRESHRHVGRRK